MLYVTLSYKGGGGKSTLAAHLISRHILKKDGRQPQELKFFEVDEYTNSSSRYLSDSQFVKSEVIKDKNINNSIPVIINEAKKSDVILDAGSGRIVSQLMTACDGVLDEKNIIFVVPYTDDSDESLSNTIKEIKTVVLDPKILIVLNRVERDCENLEEAKALTSTLYGNDTFGLPASPFLPEVDKYVKAYIPEHPYAFSIAKEEKKSLFELEVKDKIFSGASEEEALLVWKDSGVVKGDTPTEDEYLQILKLKKRFRIATRFFESTENFFNAISKLEDK